MRKIYFDHSATTPVDDRVLEKMLPFFSTTFGNPSSIHNYGREARMALNAARENLASLIHAAPDELIFTSGGTEADNLAIKGLAFHPNNQRRHIITTSVEHHAVLNVCKYLEQRGFHVTYLPVDQYGMVSPDKLTEHISEDTFLISIMHANNEVGTINPIQEIGAIAREHGICFHSDAVQSFGKIPIDVNALNVDLLSISAHKIYGPKGIGALYVRKGIPLQKLNHGGHHEYERRAGTENVPAIIGFEMAASLCQDNLPAETEQIAHLRNNLQTQILARIPRVHLNGHPAQRLPGHLNLSFEGVEGEALLLSLDLKGIAASSGSACTAGTTENSHVLLAMGIKPFLAQSAIRFTLGRMNSSADIEYTVEVLPEIIERLRKISPF